MAFGHKRREFSSFKEGASNGLELTGGGFVCTDIGRACGLTQAGRDFLSQASAFCSVFRTAVLGKQIERLFDKPGLTRKFKLPARMVHTAKMLGEAALAGAEECAKLDLVEQQARRLRLHRDYAESYCTVGDSPWLAQILSKLKKVNRKLGVCEARVKRAVLHFGGEVFGKQHLLSKDVFRAQYARVRANQIGCIGSSDELGGNSTLRLVARGISADRHYFSVSHKGKVLCEFKLGRKEGERLANILAANDSKFQYQSVGGVARRITAGRTAVMVMFHRADKGWRVHVSYSMPSLALEGQDEVLLGVDTNADSLAFTLLKLEAANLSILEYGMREFPRQVPTRGSWLNLLYGYINEIVGLAKENQATLVLENLDFEGGKRAANKLGVLLHGIPYSTILKIFTRRCKEHGVKLRLIFPAYTSILGAYFSAKHPALSRDVAAALVIALKGSAAGVDYLEQESREALARQSIRVRCNAKKRFGHTTSCVISGRQMDRPGVARPTPATWHLGQLCRETLGTVRDEHRATRLRRRGPHLLRCCYAVFASPSSMTVTKTGTDIPGGGAICCEVTPAYF